MKRVFYDIETDCEHPPYAQMTLVGALVEETGQIDRVFTWEAPFTEDKLQSIRFQLCGPDINERVGFNNLNFDDLVLYNHDIEIPEDNTHDAMLAIKTCYPNMPSFALKFLCWHLLADPHWEQFELNQTGHRFGDLVSDKLRAYHKKDLYQHRAIWDWVKDKVRSEKHWEAYQLDMRMKLPLQEMIFDGGVWVDVPKCKATLEDLQKKKVIIQEEMLKETDGKVKNANSNRQVGNYLAKVEDFALSLTNTGEFQVKKKDLADILGMDEEQMRKWKPGQASPISSVAMLAWQMRDNETIRKYVTNYYKAAMGTDMGGWIPASYSISRAATRRTLSKSYFKINFQNSTEAIDEFKIIPPEYLGWFIDSTQVENVDHIYETSDVARRLSYEADEEWNEYVWLCNRILGTNKTKKELDSIKSTQVPHWSVYKVYKTIKLALNFGMGVKKFCKDLGLDEQIGRKLFDDIHQACPAIRQLQQGVKDEIERNGFVQDTFGHIYSGPPEEAYKIVAYLIQGCGTGSLPKAQLRANYDTLHLWSEKMGTTVGMLNATTHDETSGLLRLDLGYDRIYPILKNLMFNMTKKFEHKFDNIPLRAKLYLSTTNWADRKNNEQKNWKNEIKIP